jgi:hypothetical protein
MNCKPGDLAVVVPPYADRSLLGCFVSVVRIAPPKPFHSRGGVLYDPGMPGGPGWIVDATGPNFPAAVADSCLRPIRDNDGEDETLTWAGKPETITA